MLAMCRGRHRLDEDDRDDCGNVNGGWADGVRSTHIEGAHDRAAYGRTYVANHGSGQNYVQTNDLPTLEVPLPSMLSLWSEPSAIFGSPEIVEN